MELAMWRDDSGNSVQDLDEKQDFHGRMKSISAAIGSRTCRTVGGGGGTNPVVVRASDVAFNEREDCLKVTLLGARLRSSACPRQPVHRSPPPYKPKYFRKVPRWRLAYFIASTDFVSSTLL
jgi:hypothetical protein